MNVWHTTVKFYYTLSMKINILEFSVIILAVGWDCLFIIGSMFAQYSVELP